MDTQLVVTVTAPDRPGLVNRLADAVAAQGGNWLDARMAGLGGRFAGVALVAVAPERAEALRTALVALSSPDLTLQVDTVASQAQPPVQAMRLELLGHDRPGIVRDISQVLSARGVSISEIDTERRSGSFSGEAMFKLAALLHLPATQEPHELRSALEALANEWMVDLSPA